MLQPRDPALYFLQRLRDEAHRFAIGTHRAGRTKARLRPVLDEVPGIGARPKQALLLPFRTAQAVARAGRDDPQAVEGVSRTLARLEGRRVGKASVITGRFRWSACL